MVPEHVSSSMENNQAPRTTNQVPFVTSSLLLCKDLCLLVLPSFTHFLMVKLDNNNFLIWKQQVFSAIKGYGLQRFDFGGGEIPKRFFSQEDARFGRFNQEFLEWEQQDQLRMSWLLSSISEPILPLMVGCETSFQVWGKLEQYFTVQTKAKISQFKT